MCSLDRQRAPGVYNRIEESLSGHLFAASALAATTLMAGATVRLTGIVSSSWRFRGGQGGNS